MRKLLSSSVWWRHRTRTIHGNSNPFRTSIKIAKRLFCSTNTFDQSTNTTNLPEFHIRRATLNDVQQIINCNQRNLPENYENEFIAKHILNWPMLSYVVEFDDRNIGGYALGKIEDPKRNEIISILPQLWGQQCSSEFELVGHILSIAVEEPFRRSGIGAVLLRKIHQHMCKVPNLKSVNLLCRVSNSAAVQHYSKVHGYACKHKLHNFYPDGEDGWFMEMKIDNENIKSVI